MDIYHQGCITQDPPPQPVTILHRCILLLHLFFSDQFFHSLCSAEAAMQCLIDNLNRATSFRVSMICKQQHMLCNFKAPESSIQVGCPSKKHICTLDEDSDTDVDKPNAKHPYISISPYFYAICSDMFIQHDPGLKPQYHNDYSDSEVFSISI
jgi:hypothetical protein